MGKIYGKITSPSMSESCSKSQTNPQSAGPISFLFDGGTRWYERLDQVLFQAPKSSTAPPESLPLWTWRTARFAWQCVCTLMIYSICGGVFFFGIWFDVVESQLCVCMCLVCLTVLFWDNHKWLLKSAVVMLIHGLLARTTGPWEWRIHGLSVAKFRLVNQSDLQFECTLYLYYLVFISLYCIQLQTLMWIDQWPCPQDRKAASPRVVQDGAP